MPPKVAVFAAQLPEAEDAADTAVLYYADWRLVHPTAKVSQIMPSLAAQAEPYYDWAYTLTVVYEEED